MKEQIPFSANGVLFGPEGERRSADALLGCAVPWINVGQKGFAQAVNIILPHSASTWENVAQELALQRCVIGPPRELFPSRSPSAFDLIRPPEGSWFAGIKVFVNLKIPGDTSALYCWRFSWERKKLVVFELVGEKHPSFKDFPAGRQLEKLREIGSKFAIFNLPLLPIGSS